MQHTREDSGAERQDNPPLASVENRTSRPAPLRKSRTPRYVDGPALPYALWRRTRGALLWVSLTLGVVSISAVGSGLIGLPHVVLVILSIPVLAIALVGLPHLVRAPLVRTIVLQAAGRPTHDSDSVLPPAVSEKEFKAMFARVVGTDFTDGNHVDVLINGDGTFERLWGDLRSAQRSITVQMYYAGPGVVADTTLDILAARARAGVAVYFLYDAFGTEDLPRYYIEALRTAGVHTAAYRPMRWYKLGSASHRLHARGVVIDGRIGYTGGFGIDDKWLGDGRSTGEWRDTNARFVGPAVNELQAGFVAGWSTATGQLLIGNFLTIVAAASDARQPKEPISGPASSRSVLSAVVRSPPLMGSTSAERLIALAISSATKTLYISNSYFIPTRSFAQLLIDAALRGVDVRVMTNGRASDVRTTWLAGRRSYELLLHAGVRIYEYKTTIHAKTFVVDGQLSAVTTMNFDNRSLAYNNEVALVTLDVTSGRYMESVFIDDARYSDEITLTDFQTRPWRSRVLERLASIGSRML